MRLCIRFGTIALGVALLSFPALGQTGHDGHMLYHEDAYQHWAVPGGAPGSCCRAKFYGPGGITGDCYPTEARLIDGKGWIARRDNGEWVDIPESRIIRERNPDPTGRAAHLCYSDYQNVVLCFVPPFGAL